MSNAQSALTNAMSSDALVRDGNSEAPSQEQSARLLIVDDVADNRNILTRRFQRQGYETVEASGGLQAIELLEAGKFDLVLLDVMMPGIDGIETLKRIRSRSSSDALPVIMVTANAASENVVEALELGANDYVTKPVDFAVALARVNSQIDRKRAMERVTEIQVQLQEFNEDLEKRVVERTAQLAKANQHLKKEIAQREESEAQTQYLAYHDSLTGLSNRLLFYKQLEGEILQASGSDQQISLFFIDLDGFKNVNDTLGHSVGDSLLKSIAVRLRDLLKETDFIARLGGDEFAVLQIGEKQPESAISLASKIIESVAAPCVIDGHQLIVGASVGIVVQKADGSQPEEMLRSADLAMYRAKMDGRGTYRIFDPAMDERAQARLRLETDLRRALANNEFSLVYQPQVALTSGAVTGFEALLRWNHPERGFVSPASFIPVSEEIGLIVQIGEWVLRQACAEAMKWPDHVHIAVNLSPAQFSKGNLVATVVNCLATTGLSPDRLELEVTESVLLEKSDRNFAMLDQLKALGVRISMDDFGTGYSSLSYLHRFPFDKIKIDKSFIDDLAIKPKSAAIVKAIVEMAKTLGMSTTAEGVETNSQVTKLEAMGCSDIQGYVFSSGKSPDQVPDILLRTMLTVARPAES